MTRSNTPGVDKKTAWCDERRFREVCARQSHWSLAEQVASLILRRQEDGRLQWYEDGRVRVKTALAKTGHRQLRPMAKRIYLKPLVKRILEAIRSGNEDDLVFWGDDGKVYVNTTTIFPPKSAVRMTLEGRRKRLRDAVAGVLLNEGWERLGNDCFRRKENEG